MTRILVLPLVPAAIVALACCEQRFSAAPPPSAPEGPSGSFRSIESLLASPVADAGAVEATRALMVTLCSASEQPCTSSGGEAAPDGSYRVTFGSGRAEIRSRGQAMADVYKELRDRTTSGEHLNAIPRAARASGGRLSASAGDSTKPANDSDPLTQCAFHILDLVDGVGEVAVEVAPRFGGAGCLVQLGRSDRDAGFTQCLVPEPDRPGRDKHGR
jgi:hypothetical protein